MARLYALPENAFKLVVHADGKEVWRKTVTDLHPEIRGPAGFRTDNGSFIFKVFTAHDCC